MLGRATDIISDELDAGNPTIAQWLVDRLRPPGRSDFVSLADNYKLGTVEDVVGSSERITVAASRGDISLQQAHLLQDILGPHAQLKGLEELAKLRAEIEGLHQPAKKPAIIDKSIMPSWGRLGGGD